MKNKDQSQEQFFIYILNYASAVLKCNEDTIKYLFSKAQFWNVSYISQLDNTSEIYLEVCVEGATITCTFDSDTSLCNSSYIFFDEDSTLNNFVRLCNILYNYDFNSGRWYSSYHTICLKKDKKYKDRTVVFTPIEK